MSVQPPIELHQLDPGIVSALTLITNPGTSGYVLTSNGTVALWQVPTGGTAFLSTLGDVTIPNPAPHSLTDGDILTYSAGLSKWTNVAPTSGGTVTSVAATASTGLVIVGSPITSAGTLSFTLSTELQGLAGLSSIGFVQRTGVGTYTTAALTSGQITTALGYTPGTGNGNGTVTSITATGSTGLVIGGSPITTSGTLTFTLGTELQGLAGLSTTGIISRTGAGTYVLRTITGNADILVSNGSGVSGNPTLSLSNTTVTAGTYALGAITVDSRGRVTAASTSTLTLNGDITGTLSGTNIITTLGTVNSNVGTFTNTQFTVNAKGLVTAASSGSFIGGTGISVSGTNPLTITNTGVTSFAAGSTGLTPATATTGAITLNGTLNIANGGTGQTTANNALNALLPSQVGQSGNVLTTNGTTTSWILAGGTGTVTSVSTSATGMGLTLTTSNPTTAPAITLAGTLNTSHGGTGLTIFSNNGIFYANSNSTITQVNVNASVTKQFLTQANSGIPIFTPINASDLPALVATGDATGTGTAGTGTIPLTLATVNSNVGSFTNANITVNAKGLITAAANGAGGGVTSITGTPNQITASTSTGAITLSLPPSVVLTGNTAGFVIANGSGTGVGRFSTVASWVGSGSNYTDTAIGAAGVMNLYVANSVNPIVVINTSSMNVTGTVGTVGNTAGFVVVNGSSAGVCRLGTIASWVGSGSTTDTALGAIGAMNFYVGNSVSPTIALTTSTMNMSGNLTVTGTTSSVSFNTTSDRNLKTNIATIENATDILNNINGVRFNLKETGIPSAGVIAQEVEQVMPELVITQENNTKSVNYNGLIGVLFQALKETNRKITAMALEIEKLKAV